MKGKRGKRVNGFHRNGSGQRAATNENAIPPLPPARQLRTLDPRNRGRDRPAITPVPPFLQEPPGS